MTINEYRGLCVLVTIKCSPDTIGTEIAQAVDTVQEVWRIGSSHVMVTDIEIKAVAPTPDADVYWHYIELKLERK